VLFEVWGDLLRHNGPAYFINIYEYAL